MRWSGAGLLVRCLDTNQSHQVLHPFATVATIERTNSLDRTLYRCACERLDELMRENHIPDSAVVALRRISAFYGASGNLGCPASFGRRRKWCWPAGTSRAIARHSAAIIPALSLHQLQAIAGLADESFSIDA